MAISLPQFNVSFEGWVAGNSPSAGPKDFTVNGQLYLHSRMDIDRDSTFTTKNNPNISIRILDFSPWTAGPPYVTSILQAGLIPGFKGRWIVRFWEIMHKNFPNEYIMLFCDQCDDNGGSPDAGR